MHNRCFLEFPESMRKFNRKSIFPLITVALITSGTARAHDFWIEPGAFRTQVNTRVPLRLYVGQDFKGDSLIYLPDLIERYAVVGPGGERAIEAVAGDDPPGELRPERAGLHIVLYRGRRSSATFDTPEEFERYLDKEGLERVRGRDDYRQRTSRKPIRELFSRCAKALVAVGNTDAGADRALGLRLELIAGKNPYARGYTDPLPVQLLFEGKPLAGALLVAFNKAEPTHKRQARSGPDGRASLAIDRPGVWLITAVHMLPAPKGTDAEWESLWASLSFELPAAGK